MDRDDLLMLLRQLAEGLLAGETTPALFSRTVDGLISSNLDTVPDLEPVHLRLIDYGVRGAARPVTDGELREIARRLIRLAEEEAQE
ncbi:MAG TPA: hypothetical protein VNI57_11435 [Candidatus Saccharimonadales bacterium]|nr:hypothetical protein [Candidatus Saccharimonadales bacterium]